ncbi:MAG: class I SAM-dependent methyltransferase, partial [Verrucomicrobiota bacterium]
MQLFYSCDLFQKCDLALKKMYRFRNPFTISKNFFKQKKQKEVDVYGEIPLTSLLLIAKECQIAPHDHVFELGCGRGRAAFFLRSVLLCS